MPDYNLSLLLFGEFSNYENHFTITTDDNGITLYLNNDIILDDTTDISNTYIQLPQDVVFDGSNHYIDLSNTTQCMGIIQCSNTSADSRSIIKNLGIKNGNLKEGTLSIAGSAYLLRSMPTLYVDITDCYSTGPINAYCGGLVPDGRDGGQDITITNCYNTGTIDQYAGGLCGANAGNVTITNCYNTGTIGFAAGGLCGNNANNVTITNCYNTGTISSSAGGLCGFFAYNVTITNCYNTGTIGDNAGGLCGYNAYNVTITNCYNTGTIGQFAGGLCGDYANTVTITNCYNTGTIGDNAGGLCGYNAGYDHGKITIINCYNTGTLTNPDSKSIVGSFHVFVTHIDMSYVYTSVDTSQSGDSYATLDISDIYNTYLTNKFTTDSSFVYDEFGKVNDYPILSVFRTSPFLPPMNYYKADAILNHSLANRVITNLTDADLSGVKTGPLLSGPDKDHLPIGYQTISGSHEIWIVGPYVNLEGADLTGADLTDVKTGPLLSGPDHLPIGYQTISGSYEIWIVGPYVDLSGADLTGANLTNTNVLLAKNIQHAIFTNASGPSIKHIDINSSSFTLSTIL